MFNGTEAILANAGRTPDQQGDDDMKTLTLASALVVLAATFATPGFAADKKVGDKAQAVAEITFVNKTKKRSPYVSPAVYRTDASAKAERAKNLLIDVKGKRFKKKFFKKRSFGHHRRGFGQRGFGHRGFSSGGFGHNGFGHGGFKGHGHGFGGKLLKKKFFGKLFGS